MLDFSFNILELERLFERHKTLNAQRNTNLSKEEFEATSDRLRYLKDKKVLLEERIRQETTLRDQQARRIDESIERGSRSLQMLTQIMESLTLRAPISGYLSSMDAEVGHSFSRGQRVGQIDQLDRFKVTANIDHYYVSKVTLDQEGSFDFGGGTYKLRIGKIHPEVQEDASFKVDLEFVGSVPEGIKRGESLQIDLSLSASRTTNLVSKGGYYRQTSGRWVYRISDDGSRAFRINLVPGMRGGRPANVRDPLETRKSFNTSAAATIRRASHQAKRRKCYLAASFNPIRRSSPNWLPTL